MICLYLTFTENEYDKSLLEKIYIDYKDIMYNVAYNILNDNQLSEDAVQEAFISVSKHMKKISEIFEKSCKDLRNYLIIIVKNSAFKIYNKNKKFNSDDSDFEFYDEKSFKTIEVQIENNDSQERLFELIKRLDEKYSSVLILKYYYDMKNREIASQLGISVNNVDVRIHRGKNMLKKLILKEGLYDEQTV